MVSSSDNAVDNVKPNGANNNDNYKNNSSAGLLYGKYLNYCSLPHHEMIRLANGTDHDRDGSVESVHIRNNDDIIKKQQQDSTSTTSRIVLSKEVTKVEEMTFLEEFVAILVLALGPPNVIFIVPVLTWFIGYFIMNNVYKAFIYLIIFILLPLTILPKFTFNPLVLTNSYCSYCIIKYFSFRLIYFEKAPNHTKPNNNKILKETTTTTTTTTSTELNNKQSQICVAPPHGVFPYGNILAMLIYPSLTGYYFHGLAASAALRVPFSKQILSLLGVLDASRETAVNALLQYPYTIGISTGGVAEIFETNDNNECIILKERIGLIKLAIRTGSDLVPVYIYGNTQLLSCYCGDNISNFKNILQKVSRKVGFGLIYFYGRYYLPMPYRIPVFGVRGYSISTKHLNKELNPTSEQILEIQTQLINSMQQLFDQTKHLYGWEDKQLIIK